MLYLWDLSSTERINQMSCPLKNTPPLCLGGPGSKSQSRDPNLKFCGSHLTSQEHTTSVSQNNLNNLGSDACEEQENSSQKHPHQFWVHPTSYSVSTGEFLPWRQSSQGIKLTIHLHLEGRLRMSGAIPQLPICALIVWTGTTSPSIPTTKSGSQLLTDML